MEIYNSAMFCHTIFNDTEIKEEPESYGYYPAQQPPTRNSINVHVQEDIKPVVSV